jgi:hypothetical protein
MTIEIAATAALGQATQGAHAAGASVQAGYGV